VIAAIVIGCLMAQDPSLRGPSSRDAAFYDPADLNRQLGQVRRIHVDKLTGGEAAEQIRDMLMAGLQGTRLWVITENPERADAFLRGSAEDLIYIDRRSSRDGISARGSLATKDGGFEGANRGNSREDRFSSFGVSSDEGMSVAERKHEATAAVRLVNKDGDLIWSATKESSGAKFRGAASDVTDKVVKQLIDDYQQARKPSAVSLNRTP
jgi:hypothetical protein